MINVVGLTVLALFMGGSSRPDVWSLIILRPVAVLSLFYGLWSLSSQDIVRHRFLFSMSAAIVSLVAVSLIPLPPIVWTALPGREIIVAIDEATGLSGTWRPISMAPDLTWNALFALAVPLAILTNGMKLSAAEHRVVMTVVVFGSIATMALALLQIAGGGAPAFYLYRNSSFGEPSGLFTNRNHEALFMAALLPLLGFLLATREQASRRGEAIRFLSIATALVTSVFLLVVGSRAGLIAGGIGLASFALIAGSLGDSRGRVKTSRHYLLVGTAAAIVVATVVAWAIAAGSARSVQRLMESDNNEELRYLIWPVIRDALPRFLPLGTGIGTYERVFQTIEPDAILRPTYSNHAHNDWLEVAFTGGAAGILLLAAAAVGFLVAMGRVWSLGPGPARAGGGMGLAIIFMTATGSTIDYPLRTPVLSILFALSCVWVASSLHPSRSKNPTMSVGGMGI